MEEIITRIYRGEAEALPMHPVTELPHEEVRTDSCLRRPDALAYLPAFLVRNVFFVVILSSSGPSGAWCSPAGPPSRDITLVQTLWYLTFTEAMELARPRVAGMVQEECATAPWPSR